MFVHAGVCVLRSIQGCDNNGSVGVCVAVKGRKETCFDRTAVRLKVQERQTG